MENLSSRLGLVAREVATVVLDGRPARRIVLTRIYPTDPADLWDAVTNPERIPRWFLPVTGDLRVGGTYQLEGNAGGVVEECEPPRRFRITWGMGDGEPTRVTVTVNPAEGGAELELEQLGHVPDEMWERYGPSATGLGWELALLGLDLHVPGAVTVDPAAFMAWAGGPEGGLALEASSHAWRDADVSGGTPSDTAADRARRTLAFYTGRPED